MPKPQSPPPPHVIRGLNPVHAPVSRPQTYALNLISLRKAVHLYPKAK
jgi:hypothetical protein